MAYKRILSIQDISCVGQCSMTVAMPILSACGHETCILPTAVLSTHTGGFGKPVIRHLDDALVSMAEHWISQEIRFDAILVGYLGKVDTIRAVGAIVRRLLSPGGMLIVDPAMADHGKLYAGFDQEYVREMTQLCLEADIMLPNLTEAAMMADLPCPDAQDSSAIAQLLSQLGGRDVVLTGVSTALGNTGAAVRESGTVSFCCHERVERSFHGTGDMFAACFTGALMQDWSAVSAAQLAGEFTLRAIRETIAAPAHWYGVKFEPVLPWLSSRFQ